MTYDALRARLDDGLDVPGPLVALPDGSIDVYYHLYRGRDGSVDSRAALAAFVADTETSSLRVSELAREVGGQAVNAARQWHALAGTARLYGHLDAPEFESLPFEMHSMGAPALVRVLDFADDELLLSKGSAALESWTFADLEAIDGAVDDLESASAICCMNWVSTPGSSLAYREMATLALAERPVVVDPGDVTGCTDAELEALLDALGALAGTANVILSTNAAETRRVAEAAGVETEATQDRVLALRDNMGVTAVVSHERDRAVAATPDGSLRVPNVDAPSVERRTGGGDRFDAALAVGRATGLSWPMTLALGNACASYYVATAETGSTADVRAFLEEVTLPE